MDMDDFTPRNVTKYLVQVIITAKVKDFAENVITEHTDFEEDDRIVGISSYVIGWGVSACLKPYTNKVIDKTADFIVAKREEKKHKKKDIPEEQ